VDGGGYSWVASIDKYQEQLAGTMLDVGDLLQAIQGLKSVAAPDLTEAQIIEARHQVRRFANDVATLIGAIDDLAEALESTGMGAPAAADVLSTSSEPLPDELVQDLLDIAGIPEGELNSVESGVQQLLPRRTAIAQEGLPAELEDILRDLGYSEGEVQGFATDLGVYGMLEPGLGDRRDQFRAGKQELAIVRSGALAMDVQLIGLQIQVRQIKGIPAEDVTDEDLAMLAEDELRLLIHIAHLQALWNDDPRLADGLGEWWFIERYAGRASERLETIILDTHNRGLAADLYLLLLAESLAKTARLGDAVVAKAELDWLGEVLAVRSGDPAFLANQREELRLPGLALIRASAHPWVREHVEWPLSATQVETTAAKNRHLLQEWSSNKLSNNPTLEQNLNNNKYELNFYVGYTLDAASVEIARQVLGAVRHFITHPEESANKIIGLLEVMIGLADPDNPAEFLVLILSSFIPVIDPFNDLITIVREEDPFIRVIATFSLIASLGELSYLLGFSAPVGAASTLADASLASVRGLYGASDEAFQVVMRGMKYDEAFELGTGLMRVTTKYMLDEGLTLGDDAVEVITDVMTQGVRVWDNFVPYVKVVNGKDAALLIELGFDEGGMLIGQMLRQDEVLEAAIDGTSLRLLDQVGDGLFGVQVRLSDEQADAMALMARNFESDDLRQFTGKLGGVCGFVAQAGVYKLAAPLRDNPCNPEQYLEILDDIFEFSDEGEQAYIAVVKNLNGEEIGDLLVINRLSPAALEPTFLALDLVSFQGWSKGTIDKGIKFVDEFGYEMDLSVFMDKISTNINKNIYDDQVSGMITKLADDVELRDFFIPDVFEAHPEAFDDISGGIAQQMRRWQSPNTPYPARYGYEFQLERAKIWFESGRGRLVAVERFERIGETEFSLDLLLEGGEAVENKYWRWTTLHSNAASVANQVQTRVESGRKVILEFGQTAKYEIDGYDNAGIQKLFELLDRRGIEWSIDPDDFNADVIIQIIERIG